ncbi:MAG: redox-regulated ATPase YchF [Bacilli bacterium]|nr:redox-regulated ATPase YchF [Bacilli bacterium]
MALKTGIIGLPNVGKSTLFNAITKLNVVAANYPFATIDPNIAVVPIIDDRLDYLSSVFKPEKKTYATFKFFDIAGLVKGASKGEGLGNRFLSQIRECDVLVEVVRCFKDVNITHVEGNVDIERDIKIIELELIMADLEIVVDKINKNQSRLKNTNDKKSLFELEALNLAEKYLNDFKMLYSIDFGSEIYNYFFHELRLFSIKPIVFVANISLEDLKNTDYFIKKIKDIVGDKTHVIPICCNFEQQISTCSEDDKKFLLESVGVNNEMSCINKLTMVCNNLLGLSTFFTVGSDECKAWTFKNGSTAEECAGIIHSDIKRGFIKAEVYNYEDFKLLGSEQKIKESGKLRLEGKNYQVKDGDIIFFRFNV